MPYTIKGRKGDTVVDTDEHVRPDSSIEKLASLRAIQGKADPEATVTAANAPGSYNYTGAADPAIDAMIQAMLAAEDRSAFVDAVHALDRVLLSGFYVLPLYNSPDQWIARWTRLQHPDSPSLTGAEPDTWWVAPGR